VASTAAIPVSPSRELASELEFVDVDDDDDHDDWVVITGDEAGVVIIVVAATVAAVGVLTKVNASLPEELMLLPLTLPPSIEQDVTPAKQMRPSAQPYPSGQDWTHAVDASS
jgi:hypothetical protein